MKTTYIPGIFLLLVALVFALVSANFNQSFALARLPDPSGKSRVVPGKNPLAASISFQTTLTPAAEDASEIGSTDGILIMGMVIVVIIMVPILFYKKK